MVRVVRFMFEHGHAWPLWEDGTTTYAMEPDDYGLSLELTTRLRSCYELFETHRDLAGQWDSPVSRERWRAESDQALAVLQREVAHLADVRDERD